MSDADLTASRSIHQADCRLSDVSRGRQCVFRSVSLLQLKCANSCRVSQWTANTVDQIMIGDAIYEKVFDDDTIPDTETLSLTYFYLIEYIGLR